MKAGLLTLCLPAGPPADTACCQPAPRQGSVRPGRPARVLPGPGGGCAACAAAPPPGQCWCPSSLACLHGPALRQVRALEPGHSRGRRRKVESPGHHPPGPSYSQWNKNKPLHRSRLLPLGRGPGSKSAARLRPPSFAPAQEEALPVLFCVRPLLPRQAPAQGSGQIPARWEETGA